MGVHHKAATFPVHHVCGLGEPGHTERTYHHAASSQRHLPE